MTVRLNTASGSGSVAIAAPNSTAGDAARTITLPDDSGSGTILTTSYPSSRCILEHFQIPLVNYGSGDNLAPKVATSKGEITLTAVTAKQDLTGSFADITGSTITYEPPTGTKFVIYKFHFSVTRADDDTASVAHYKFFIDSDEVTKGRMVTMGEDLTAMITYEWTIGIGDQGLSGGVDRALASSGAVSSWSGNKTLKLQGSHNPGNNVKLHCSDYWEGNLAEGSEQLIAPRIGITAIG